MKHCLTEILGRLSAARDELIIAIGHDSKHDAIYASEKIMIYSAAQHELCELIYEGLLNVEILTDKFLTIESKAKDRVKHLKKMKAESRKNNDKSKRGYIKDCMVRQNARVISSGVIVSHFKDIAE